MLRSYTYKQSLNFNLGSSGWRLFVGPRLSRSLQPRLQRYWSTKRNLESRTDSSISSRLSYPTTSRPTMVQRDFEGNWVPDHSRVDLVKERHEQDLQPNSKFDHSAPVLGSFSLDASIVGSHGMAEMQRAAQRAQNTRAHAAVRERATVAYESQYDLSEYEASHAEFDYASYWQQQHQLHQRHQLQQQMVQQQVHHGGFYPTPPNFNNHPHYPPRNPPVIPQGFQPQTHPPSNAPPVPEQQRKSSPSPKFRRPDAIVVPSAASGGVPDPTPAYHLRASFLPRTLPEPQPLLVIIDLNGTLVHRPSHKSPRHIVPRPFAQQFLKYCIDTFHVMIWSSARPGNVAAMCEKLIERDRLGRVVAVWGRDRFGLSADDYNCRVQCYKRLSKVWRDPAVRATYPADFDDAGRRRRMIDGGGQEEEKWRPGSWNQGNTVLIDDSREKARSEPHNAIEIPEFSGKETEHVLPRVHDYLNTLACQADVSTYIRVHPFKPADKQ